MDDPDGSDPANPEAIHNLLERVDTLVRDAESVRAHVDRMMRRRPFWPERRQPKHWSEERDIPPNSEGDRRHDPNRDRE